LEWEGEWGGLGTIWGRVPWHAEGADSTSLRDGREMVGCNYKYFISIQELERKHEQDDCMFGISVVELP
jgi:hypothetical protein